MVENLKQKAATGILWKFLDQGGTQLIQFISGIYIARILSPDDYGLVGMMAIFLGISQAFIDSGFKGTLIQKGDKVTQDDYNVVFYFSAVISLFFYFLLFFSAPIISEFYNEARLTMIARGLGLILVFNSFGIIQQIIFEKKINFRVITKINLFSILISVCSGVVLAINGFGVWALVTMFLTESFVRTSLFWIINKWRPNFTFRFKTFKALFSMGSKLLFAGILSQVSMNIYSLVIGKVFTTTDVGYYSQGRKLQQRIGDFITYSIQGVLFPVQSLIKDDIPRLKNAIRKNQKVSTIVAFPAIFGLMAIAKPFVILALTEKWLPSVDYIYILSIAGLFFVVSGAIGSYVVPIGKINFYVGLSVFYNLVLIIFIGLGVYLEVSLKVLVASKILQEVINFIVAVYYSKKFIGYRISEVLKDIFPATIISIVMGVCVYFLGYLLGISFLVLGLQVVLGIIVYILLNFFFNKKLYNELRLFVFDFLKAKYMQKKPRK